MCSTKRQRAPNAPATKSTLPLTSIHPHGPAHLKPTAPNTSAPGSAQPCGGAGATTLVGVPNTLAPYVAPVFLWNEPLAPDMSCCAWPEYSCKQRLLSSASNSKLDQRLLDPQRGGIVVVTAEPQTLGDGLGRALSTLRSALGSTQSRTRCRTGASRCRPRGRSSHAYRRCESGGPAR